MPPRVALLVLALGLFGCDDPPAASDPPRDGGAGSDAGAGAGSDAGAGAGSDAGGDAGAGSDAGGDASAGGDAGAGGDASAMDRLPPGDAGAADRATPTDVAGPEVTPLDADPRDLPEAGPPRDAAVDIACGPGERACDGVAGCLNLAIESAHCGACGRACSAGASCVAGVCVAAARVTPRPIAPGSLSEVTQRRPLLRWQLPAGYTDAEVELCRDRACAAPLETLRARGNSARPTAELPARSVVFWRLRASAAGMPTTDFGPTWWFRVPSRGATAGVDTSHSPHGDVNGDGFDDVVLGVAQADPGGRMNAGAVRVYLGGPAGIPATPQQVLEGATAGDFFGDTVSEAGDLNGDGYGDILVGAKRADPGGRVDAGRALVYFGGPTGLGSAPVSLEGESEGDAFGSAVASAGDLDGDGFADVLIGASDDDVGALRNAGSVAVFFGAPGGLRSMTRSVLTGTTALESFGFAVAGLGDVDGNGYGDFAVGAPSASPSMRRLAGAVTIYLGSAAGFSASRVVEGPVLDTYFGWSVAGLGDLDGDGFTDVGVGSPLASQGGRQYCGSVTVFRGGRGGVGATPQRVLFGGAANDRAGSTLGGGGDLDGDGFADVLVGASQASPMGRELAGAVAVFAGSAAGLAETPQRVLVGANRSDGFGSALSGAMDVNRDGFADAVIGVNGADPGGRSGAGAASVYLGDAGGLGAAPQRVLEGAAVLDALGRAIACGVSPRRRHPHRNG